MNNTKLNTVFSYPSKLILFGEYTVLFGGDALAIPYDKYGCLWQKGRAFEHPELGKHIDSIVQSYPGLFFDQNEWVDYTKLFYLHSNIPLGYGLGSSGAVVAAIFDRFFNINYFQNDLVRLKIFLGEIESFFHGKSSGLDPLVCLIKKPILIKDNFIKIVKLEDGFDANFKLIDSKTPRENKIAIQAIINLYNEDLAFQDAIKKLTQLNNMCIKLFLQSRFHETKDIVREISDIQLKYFDTLIPNHFKAEWKENLHSNRSYFKLCGGGGGGFFYSFIY